MDESGNQALSLIGKLLDDFRDPMFVSLLAALAAWPFLYLPYC